MTKKRFLSCILVVLFSALVIQLPVYAHPGKTDSKGGHRDRSTGEYHYHHGYEAHDHYDMDRDGDVDCPFGFDDQTEHNSSSSSSGSYAIEIPDFDFSNIPEPATELPTVPEWHKESLQQSSSISRTTSPPSSFSVVFGVIAFIFSIFYLPYSLIQKGKQTSSKPISPVEQVHTPEKNTYPPSTPQTHSPEFISCHHIWISTYHIARHLGITNNRMLHGYIWAAMFYVTTKYIRDQKIVDEIYSHFDSASTGIADPEPYPSDKIHYVSFNYRYFAPILNQSGIDPRTPSGLDELWALLCKNVHNHKEPFPSAYQAFIDYAAILIADASKYESP